MIVALLLLALAAGDRLAVEVVPEKTEAFVHESVRVTLRVVYDAEWFAAHAVQPFHRELDVPLQIEAPWLEASPAARGLTVALNDTVVPMARGEPRTVGARSWAVLEAAGTLSAAEPGVIGLAAPRVRFVHATEFREDFLSGRVGVDPRRELVEGEAVRIAVRALPGQGRPDGFSGAVGRFTVSAEAGPREVARGEPIRLVLRIGGEGDFGTFDAPRLDGLAGFHVYGMLEERAPDRRVVTYEIAPLDARVTEVPPIPFSWFEPGPEAGYRTAHTDPIPITVHGAPEPAPRPPPVNGTFPLMPVAAGALLLVAGGLLWLRRTRRTRPHPDEMRVREAEAALAAGGDDRARLFAGLVAAWLRCPPAAVVSPDLPGRLEQAGVDGALARQIADHLARLVALGYGSREDALMLEVDTRALAAALREALSAGTRALETEESEREKV